MINLILITGHKHINDHCKSHEKYNVLLEYYYGKEVSFEEIGEAIENTEGPVTFLFMDDIGDSELLHPILLKAAGKYTDDRFDIIYITKDLVSQVDVLLIANDFGVTNVHEKTTVGFLELDFILQKKLKADSLKARLLRIKEEESVGERRQINKKITEFIKNEQEEKNKGPLGYKNTHLFYNIRGNSGLTSTMMNLAYVISEYGVYKIKEDKQLPYICILDLNFKSPNVSLYGGRTFNLGVDRIFDDINHLLGLEQKGTWDKELAESIINSIASNVQKSAFASHVSVLGMSNECYQPDKFSYITELHINFIVDALQGMFDVLLIDVGDDFLLTPSLYQGIKDRNIHCVGLMDMTMGSLVEMKRKQEEIYGTDIIINKTFKDVNYDEEVFKEHLSMFEGSDTSFIYSVDPKIAHEADVKGNLLFKISGDDDYQLALLNLADKYWKIANLERAKRRIKKGTSIDSSDYIVQLKEQVNDKKDKIKNKIRLLMKNKKEDEVDEDVKSEE